MAARVFRILVVDDNRDDLGLTARVVGRHGHEVRVADNGQAALAIARRFRPQVALVDMVLPDVEGCDLVRDLKGLPGMEDLRIFILSGYGEDVSRQRAAAAGCDGYLVKPLESGSLESVLAGSG